MRRAAEKEAEEVAMVSVRGMERGDAEAVAELCGELGYQRSGDEIRAWIGRIEARPERQMAFVAVAEERLVGWIEVSVVDPLQTESYAQIGGLVVKDGMRGAGVGRLLCRAAEEWGWARGVPAIRVMSRVTRKDAHRFYMREGYAEVKTSVVLGKERG